MERITSTKAFSLRPAADGSCSFPVPAGGSVVVEVAWQPVESGPVRESLYLRWVSFSRLQVRPTLGSEWFRGGCEGCHICWLLRTFSALATHEAYHLNAPYRLTLDLDRPQAQVSLGTEKESPGRLKGLPMQWKAVLPAIPSAMSLHACPPSKLCSLLKYGIVSGQDSKGFQL